MHYINIFFISILLVGCTSNNNSIKPSSPGVNTLEQTDSDISRYKTALSLLNSDKFDDAKEILTQITLEKPGFAGPYANLAVIALNKGNPDEALGLVKTALTKNPQLSQALNLLGIIEQQSGNITLALEHYKQAIAIRNDYANAHYNIALLYDIYFQDIHSALSHYEIYLKLIHNNDKSTSDWVEQLKQSRPKG